MLKNPNSKSKNFFSFSPKILIPLGLSALYLLVTLLVNSFGNSKTDLDMTPVAAEQSPVLSQQRVESETFKENDPLIGEVELEPVTVTKVIDGDTIDTTAGRIRFIGLDTPETKDPRKPVQCFGKEAAAKMSELLSNQKVYLQKDPSQGDLDKYQRLLRYVYLQDGRNVAHEMIYHGFGHEYTYRIPYKWQVKFKAAQKSAEQNNRGLWDPNTCNGDTGRTPISARSNTTSSPPANSTIPDANKNACKIKGNINRRGVKLYHLPGQKYYNKTKINTHAGERWFCSEQEALDAGWRKSQI